MDNIFLENGVSNALGLGISQSEQLFHSFFGLAEALWDLVVNAEFLYRGRGLRNRGIFGRGKENRQITPFNRH